MVNSQMVELNGVAVICGSPIQQNGNGNPYVFVRLKTLGYFAEIVYFDAVVWGANHVKALMPMLKTGQTISFRAVLCNKKLEGMKKKLLIRLVEARVVLRAEEKIPTTNTEAALTILDTIDPYKLLGGDYSELLSEEGETDE